MEFIRSKKQVVKLNSHLAQYLRNRNENKPVFLFISSMHKQKWPGILPNVQRNYSYTRQNRNTENEL